jgi:hypothetical protein
MRRYAGLADDESPRACSGIVDGMPEGAWRVDPVHLRLGTDHVVLTDPATIGLSGLEVHALAEAVAPCANEEGLALLTPAGGRWYLVERDTASRLDVRPRTLLAAIGRSIDAYLPVGPDARRWRRLLNTVQMTWFDHPVNQAREAGGLPAINGLWLDGRCPRRAPDDDAREALAALATGAVPEASAITLDTRLLEARIAGDPAAWLQAWQAVDASLLSRVAAFEHPFDGGVRIVFAGDAGWREVLLRPGRGSWSHWRPHWWSHWRPRWWPRRGAAQPRWLLDAGSHGAQR